MTLKVIGAGWGRTGTRSMQEALHTLGYRCHHMLKVFALPEQAALFTEAARKPSFDWERIYAGYDATVDFPGCVFWRELAAYYPDAKVILTVRPVEEYYESYHATIEAPMAGPLRGPTVDEHWDEMIRRAVLPRAFGDGDPADRGTVMTNFERHNAEVQAEIPASRLLVFAVTEGWEPITNFLGLPTPKMPFPHSHTRDEWRRQRR